jgi:hypothetical protein
MTTWQPLDTAPHDGTEILGVYACEHYYHPTTVFWGVYHPNAPGRPCWREARGRNKVLVTHWMPLPPRPGGVEES